MYHVFRYINGIWHYIETAKSLDAAQRATDCAACFYATYGVTTVHLIGIQRGTTLEYVPAS